MDVVGILLLLWAGWLGILLLSVIIAVGAITLVHYLDKYVDWLDRH